MRRSPKFAKNSDAFLELTNPVSRELPFVHRTRILPPPRKKLQEKSATERSPRRPPSHPNPLHPFPRGPRTTTSGGMTSLLVLQKMTSAVVETRKRSSASNFREDRRKETPHLSSSSPPPPGPGRRGRPIAGPVGPPRPTRRAV